MISGIGGGAVLLQHKSKQEQKKRWNIRFGLCLAQSEKDRKERERIKQFSIWFEEIDSARQQEYAKRRRNRNKILNQRFRNIKSFKFLLIPTSVFLLSGIAILCFANLDTVKIDTIFEKEKTLFNVIGGVLIGVGVLLLLIVEGCISHINFRIDEEKKENALAELEAEKLLPQNFPVFTFKDGKLPDPLCCNDKAKRDTETLAKLERELECVNTRSTQEQRNDSRGAKPKRPPKLGMLGKGCPGGYYAIESIDSETSAATGQFTPTMENEPRNETQGQSEMETLHAPSEQQLASSLHSSSTDSLGNLPGATCADFNVIRHEAVFQRVPSDDSLNDFDHLKN